MRKNPAAVTAAERLLQMIMVVGLADGLLFFFMLDADPRAKTAAGSSGALLFLLAAGLYVAWNRLSPPGSARGPRNKGVVAAAENTLLIALAAFLFALSFPGFLSPAGVGPAAFISLVPVFIVIRRCGWTAAAVCGGAYGFLAHALFNYWLAAFHPIALTVVLSIRAVYYIVLFLLLKFADRLFPRWAFLVQTALWLGYEFLSAQGFLAYSYGILGYSQYQFIPLLQAASFAGVWVVSFFVIFPGVYAGNAWRGGYRSTFTFLKKTLPAPAAYAAVLTAALIYGFVSPIDVAVLPRLKVACIQHNIDPWVGGETAYENGLALLMRLSEQAERAGPDLVVWPETALVPSVRYHIAYRENQERYNRIIKPFLEFMDGRRAAYLVGNNDHERAGEDEFGQPLIKSYNAALLFLRQEILGVYRKTHLVPFTEHFPYKHILPCVYDWLAGEDTHFYDPGDDRDADKLFSLRDVRFSALICFEDTFGEIARRFAERGAEIFINLTNDAWSASEAAETQHLAIAVFRAVENRRSLVRCTTSGVTAVIDPNGVITDRLPPFTQEVMVADVPVNRGSLPPAAVIGDWLGGVAVIAACAGLAGGAIAAALRRQKRRRAVR